MIFTKLILENYGLFSGRNEFNLRPRILYGKERPIILFGGKNGAGKTTFLGAIGLLFYGRRSLEGRLGQKDYEQALLAKTHRSKLSEHRVSFSKVGLGFDHVRGGVRSEFYVERSWNVTSAGSVREYFKVEKNGELLDEVGADHWEAFIADLVPERLSQLFFFDGEKIKAIADDQSSNAAISEAIESLLGLDAVSALKADLAIYRSRLIKAENPEAFDRQLAECQKELERLKNQKPVIDAELEELASKLDGYRCTLTNRERELQERGGSLAEERGKNQHQKEQLTDNIHKLEENLRDYADSAAPFTLCPRVSADLINQLHKEQISRAKDLELQAIEKLRIHLFGALPKSALAKKTIAEFLSQEVERYNAALSARGTCSQIHGFSDRLSVLAEELILTKATDDANSMIEALQKLESAHSSLMFVQRDLENTPDQNELKEILTSLNSANQKLAAAQQKKVELEESKRKLEYQISVAERQKEKLEERLEKNSRQHLKLEQIRRMGPALEEYRRLLAQAKIERLQSEVTICFNFLARKDDFVRQIHVDPTTFGVTLFDKQGRPVPKEELSSGEKQIFAIALLWGLARTSGRPLPVVIDTPLGRLDSDHRSSLIRNYFPNAGHQVILLSTDTEVDQSLFTELSNSISHCYHLEYDHVEGRTSAAEEYFWKPARAA